MKRFKQFIKENLESDIKGQVASITMYRGARDDEPEILKGPSFFSSNEMFAKSYGNTAPFQLRLENPKIVDNDEWGDFQTGPYTDNRSAVQGLIEGGYDSAISVFENPVAKIYVVFLLDPSKAKLTKDKGTFTRPITGSDVG